MMTYNNKKYQFLCQNSFSETRWSSVKIGPEVFVACDFQYAYLNQSLIHNISYSYMSPIDHEVSKERNANEKSYACKDPVGSDRSDSSCFLSCEWIFVNSSNLPTKEYII